MSNEFPESWQVVPLGDVVSKIVDGSHNPPKKQDEGFPMLSAKNVTSDGLVFDSYRLISKTAFEREHRRTNIEPNDVLLTIVGSIGRSCVVPVNIPSFTLQRSVAVLKPVGLEPSYLSYQLGAPGAKEYFDRNARGTAQKGVYLSTLSGLPIAVAPEREQEKIASKIDELFSRIEEGERALERVRKLVERYRQSVLKAAVTGELTREWREKRQDQHESGQALLERILKARRAAWEKAELKKLRARGKPPTNDNWKQKYKEPTPPDTTDLPELPEGWVWASLPQLGEFGRGKSKHRPRNDPQLYDGDYPFLQTGRVRASNGRIKEYDTTYNEKGLTQSRLWPKGTICITIAANIAASGILEIDACFPDSVVGLIPADGVVAEYVEFFIRTEKESLDNYAPATAQKNINLEILERVAVPLPPLAEQEEIYSKAQEELSKIDNIETTLIVGLEEAFALRQSILRSAFKGELVNQDPTDEPASVLLERIAAERAAQPVAPRRGRKKKSKSA